jgi:hypothetical protein
MKTKRNFYPLVGALLCGLCGACVTFVLSLLVTSVPAIWHVLAFVVGGGFATIGACVVIGGGRD